MRSMVEGARPRGKSKPSPSSLPGKPPNIPTQRLHRRLPEAAAAARSKYTSADIFHSAVAAIGL